VIDNLYLYNFTFYLVEPAGDAATSNGTFRVADITDANSTDLKPSVPPLVVISEDQGRELFNETVFRCVSHHTSGNGNTRRVSSQLHQAAMKPALWSGCCATVMHCVEFAFLVS
jgi:hypothetical protein